VSVALAVRTILRYYYNVTDTGGTESVAIPPSLHCAMASRIVSTLVCVCARTVDYDSDAMAPPQYSMGVSYPCLIALNRCAHVARAVLTMSSCAHSPFVAAYISNDTVIVEDQVQDALYANVTRRFMCLCERARVTLRTLVVDYDVVDFHSCKARWDVCSR
jgi:hypothetical protein